MNKITSDRWSKGYIDTPFLEHREFVLEKEFWDSKERTYGKVTLNNGMVYKAFTWKIAAENDKDRTQKYIWNDRSYMTNKTVIQKFLHKPIVQGIIQSTGDLIINAGSIENHYSIIEAARNANIHASVLTNLGASTYKNIYLGCKAGTDNCYAYNADGSRNTASDLANDTFRHISSEVTDTISGLIQVVGTLNLAVDQLNNTAAKGSITGGAHFEAKSVGSNSLDALKGLTAVDALFMPNINMSDTGDFIYKSALALPKSQLSSLSSALPKQNFLYKTRLGFLNVNKFYGAAYYLSKIGYKSDKELFFLGDAYFEKQLIEKQMRDLVGQGLGKEALIPGKDAIEQVKILLDRGAEYTKAHNLPFGKALSEKKMAGLETPMVMYVCQRAKGMNVYAPVLYIPKKERACFVSSGALVTGKDINITAKNMINSGMVHTLHQLHIKDGELLGKGGHFIAGDDIVMLADNIRFKAGHTNVESIKTVLKTDALSAGGNAVAIAKQDITVSGVRLKTKGALALSAAEGILSVASATNTNRMGQSVSVIQHQSEVSSRGSIAFLAAKDLNVAGSHVHAHDTLYLKTERNISIDATRNSINHHIPGQTSRFVLHKCSHLSAGKDINFISGRDISVFASNLAAKGNMSFAAQGAMNIAAKADKVEYHLQSKSTQIDRHVLASIGASIKSKGDFTIIAGQDGKPHNFTLTASSIAANGKVEMRANNDILINNAESSLNLKISDYTKGGFFGGGKSVHNNVEVSEVMGSNIFAGEGIALESGKDTHVIESTLITNIADETKDQVERNILLKSGGNIFIKGAEEKFNQQQKWIKKAFLNEKRSNKSEMHKTPVSSTFGAEGDIVIESQGDTIISDSQIFTEKGMSVTGESISIDGMNEHHSNSSQEHKSGFGVGSVSNFIFIGGKESKTQNDEIIEYKGSSLNAGGNIKIAAEKSNVHILGSSLKAHEKLSLSAAHDVNVKDGCKNRSSNSQEESFGFAIQVTKKHNHSASGIVYAKAKKNQEENSTVQSDLIGGKDVQINADHDVRVQAANILAERDVNIYAGHDVKLLESHDVSHSDEVHEKSFASINTSVNVGIVDTVKDMSDATKRLTNKDEKYKVSNGVVAGKKAYDLYNKGKNFFKLYNGNTGESSNATRGSSLSTKDVLANTASASSSFTVGFQSEKSEASSQVSTAVTDKIEAGRTVNMESNKGSIHGVGTEVMADTKPAYQLRNDTQNGNITLKADQNIKFESAQNTENTQTHSQSISVNVGTNYNPSGMGGTGNISFSQGKNSSVEVQYKNSHIVSKGDINITNGANTSLEGELIAEKSVKGNIGGDFTITSRCDTGHTSSKQKSITIGFNIREKVDTATTNVSFQKDKSSSDYESVVEQSGIKTGEKGFDITVTGKTTLNGGIIKSSAPADQNSLNTETITTKDIANSTHATTSSDGISIIAGGPMYQGKYGVVKNIAKNILDHSTKQDSKESYTKSAISNGTIILTDETGLRTLTEQDAEQKNTSLNSNTAGAHQGVQQLDIVKLKHITRENRKMKTQLLEEGLKISDEAYKTMFIKEHPIAVVDRDEKGRIISSQDKKGRLLPQYHYLTSEEKEHLQVGSDGKVHVSFNGLFTSTDAAARYAVQFADNKNDPHYFVVFPKSDSALSELMVGGYQKFMENNFFGLTNSTKKVQSLLKRYGNEGLHIDAYSRGSMTVGNGMHDFEKRGIHSIAGNTSINLFGPAYNAQDMANTLDKLSHGKQKSVGLENHKYDFVGTMIGGNPYTFEKIPIGSNALIETLKLIKAYPSVHSCLGSGSPKCRELYGPSHRVQISSGIKK
ncbi:hemagglutinin repeat-containing protein [Bartonella senegalensis]|uniref:hemagglutinin repeat-containing protein n=1 Tax=Bartonella senegalensis TaxID=1468418 RepID=UPI001FCAACD5|nr:hemagglutinin repeat-containing protein [Bartonella senegalensis]